MDNKYCIAINRSDEKGGPITIELDNDSYRIWIKTPGCRLHSLPLRYIIELIRKDFADPSKGEWVSIPEHREDFKDIDKYRD